MNKLNNARESFKQLDQEEKKVLIFELLFKRDISYTELSDLYVAVLQKQEDIANRKLHKSSLWLGEVWTKIPTTNKFLRAASAYAILRSGVFHTAPIEKKYEEYLKENPYEEDDNGFPITKLPNRETK